jgi:hypothetical protein
MEARKITFSTVSIGRVLAQAASHCRPTAVARARDRVRSRGTCGGQSGTGVGFSDNLGFSCPSFDRLLHTHHLPSSGASTIGQIVADVSSGLNLTKPKETKKNCFISSRNIIERPNPFLSFILISILRQLGLQWYPLKSSFLYESASVSGHALRLYLLPSKCPCSSGWKSRTHNRDAQKRTSSWITVLCPWQQGRKHQSWTWFSRLFNDNSFIQ